jgi:hypothetical protein
MRWLPWETSRYAFKGPINLASSYLTTTCRMSKAKCRSHTSPIDGFGVRTNLASHVTISRDGCSGTEPGVKENNYYYDSSIFKGVILLSTTSDFPLKLDLSILVAKRSNDSTVENDSHHTLTPFDFELRSPRLLIATAFGSYSAKRVERERGVLNSDGSILPSVVDEA